MKSLIDAQRARIHTLEAQNAELLKKNAKLARKLADLRETVRAERRWRRVGHAALKDAAKQAFPDLYKPDVRLDYGVQVTLTVDELRQLIASGSKAVRI